MAKKSGKKPSSKKSIGEVAKSDSWRIVQGELTRPRGRPEKMKSLFKFVGEKVPYEFLGRLKQLLNEKEIGTEGVYIAHDSMGYPRYIGRGNIVSRLEARKKAQSLELSYFSFFVVENKIHEREVETIMIRAAGPLLDFNSRKVRNDIQPGDVRDFEPGTAFVERQYKRGRKRKTTKVKK